MKIMDILKSNSRPIMIIYLDIKKIIDFLESIDLEKHKYRVTN